MHTNEPKRYNALGSKSTWNPGACAYIEMPLIVHSFKLHLIVSKMQHNDSVALTVVCLAGRFPIVTEARVTFRIIFYGTQLKHQ